MSSAVPRAISAAKALERLRSIKLRPASEAVAHLGVLQDSSRLLLLYRNRFPDEYARSSASTHIPVCQGEPGYSEREIDFLRLVDRNLFPLPEMMFDMERLSRIPICPQGVDWEDDPDCLRLSLRAAMALVSDEEPQSPFWETCLPQRLRPRPGERDWKHFEELCRQERGLATRFPRLIELAGHDTGNMWLDVSWECCWEEYPWEDTAIDYLTKEWAKAQRLLAQIDPLMDQMDKHPRFWVRRLVVTWNAAIKAPATSVA